MVVFMSAQPAERRVDMRWSPDPDRQREAGYTVEDVLALPDDAPRVELRDGVMIVVPSPTVGHQTIQFLLQRWLWDRVPGHLRVAAAVGVALEINQTFEPDVLILSRTVGVSNHYAAAEHVVLAVEIVSAGTRRRDRIEKPADYAAAGIAHYWRVEQDPVHVYAYELGDDRSYRLVADSDTELVLSRPFDIALSIGDITP
jgi:Uma2 family endonuclease